MQNALVEGALLTVLVVFVFLNSWRSTVITGLALPVSVLASFVAVWWFGFTLNTMSLLGLSLSIGILIDDAIVVRENIVRHVERGKDHWTAAHEGTAEIGLAVAATTFSIVVVFVPIAFMGDLAGQWFKPFALTIACSVLVSLFVSFSLDPMLSAYWPDPDIPMAQRSFVSRGLDRFNRWFDRRTENYKRVIGWALDHRLSMVFLAIASFVGALALPFLGLVGGSFLPDSDEAEFLVNIDTPPGSSLDYTKLKSEEVARLARGLDGALYSYTTIGGRTESVDQSIVYVRLKPKHERQRQSILKAELRAKLSKLGGVTASIGSGNFENQKQIQLQLRGPDVTELNRLAQIVQAEVKKVPGAVDVGLSTRGQKPEIDVALDRGLAGSLGVSVGQVGQTLRVAFAGLDAGDWVDPSGETRDVYVRLKPEARASVRDLASLPLFVPGPDGHGVAVPLGQVAKISTGIGPARIDHLDRDRVISIQANTEVRSLNEVLSEVQSRVANNVKLPAGYSVSLGGEGKDQAEVFGQIFSSLGLGDAADVLRAGGAVRLVPRSVRDHAVAAAVADRRDAGAARDGLDDQHHEHDRRDPADGHRRQERDPAGRLRQVGGGGRADAPPGDHRGRPDAAAADPDDHVRADRRHDSDRHRRRRGRRLPRPARPRGDRRRDHVDDPDAAGDPDVLRDPHRVARLADVEAHRQAAGARARRGAARGPGRRRPGDAHDRSVAGLAEAPSDLGARRLGVDAATAVRVCCPRSQRQRERRRIARVRPHAERPNERRQYTRTARRPRPCR